MEEYVHTHINDRVATIEFFHPAHNSMPSHQLESLKNEIEKLDVNSSVSIILLKSAGDRSFCAGASFTELASIQDEASSVKFFMGFANVINAIRKSNKIVIGRVQGKAVGGGVGLASACDYTFATQYASIRLSELAVGIGPFVIGPVVERKCGVSFFSQMALTPEVWQEASQAYNHGIYNSLFTTVESLDEEISKFIASLCCYNPEALRELKKIFWQGTDHWEELLPQRAAISGKLLLSDFSKNAIAKYR